MRKKRKRSCVHSRPNGFLPYVLRPSLGEGVRDTLICTALGAGDRGTSVGTPIIPWAPLCYCLHLTEEETELKKQTQAILLLKRMAC